MPCRKEEELAGESEFREACPAGGLALVIAVMHEVALGQKSDWWVLLDFWVCVQKAELLALRFWKHKVHANQTCLHFCEPADKHEIFWKMQPYLKIAARFPGMAICSHCPPGNAFLCSGSRPSLTFWEAQMLKSRQCRLGMPTQSIDNPDDQCSVVVP